MVDKNAAYLVAIDELKQDQTLKTETELPNYSRANT
jgi:hypothetical protein